MTTPGRDFASDLVRTRGIEITVDGCLAAAPKPIMLYSDADDADFGDIVSIVPNGNSNLYYIVTNLAVFSVSTLTGALTKLDATNQPDIQLGSDGTFFAGALVVSGDTTVKSWASGWTNRVTGLSANFPILLEVFENKVNLAVSNGNIVRLYDTSYSLQITLTIPEQFIVSTMRWIGGMLVVGTRHKYGGRAKVFHWYGATTYANVGYDCGSDWVYSLEAIDGTYKIVTSAGLIRTFNGSGFSEAEDEPLPVAASGYSWLSSASIAASSYGNVPHRGMAARGKTLFINVKGDLNQNIYDFPGSRLPEMPSGLWKLTRAEGLRHFMGYGHKKYRTLTITGRTSNELQASTDHKLETGDPILANSVSNITGLTNSHQYFIIKESESSFQLALSQSDAAAGRAITLSGTPSGDTFYVDDTSSVATTFDVRAGAISALTQPMSNSFFGREVLFGGEYLDSTGTTHAGLYSASRQAGVGYAVTTPIPATGFLDDFQTIYLQILRMYYDAEYVEVKYRRQPRAGLPTPGRVSSSGFATWVDAATFTIDTTAKDFKSAEVGDEIEIVSGQGAGQLAHIAAIDDTTSIWSVTLDRSLNGVTLGDLSEIVVEDWTLLDPRITASQLENELFEQTLGDGLSESLIQFKLVVSGYNAKVRYFDCVATSNKAA